MLLSDIGEGSRALYCLTNITQCCSNETGGERGQWTLPSDGSSSDLTTGNLYIVHSNSSLLLNRRSMGQIGVYRCVIPDARGVLRTLYIGIYENPSEGEVICMQVEILRDAIH